MEIARNSAIEKPFQGFQGTSSLTLVNMGVSKYRGTPKWMVYFMENPIKMDDLGVPLETPIFNIHLPIEQGSQNTRLKC